MTLRLLVTGFLHATPEDAKAFEDAQPVQVGSDLLRQHYTVMATSEMAAARLLDEDAERTLVEMAAGQRSNRQKLQIVAVVYWSKGIQIAVNGQITEIEKLEYLVRLGLALASGQRPSVWS
jgi:hypothetical protein